MVDYPTDLRLGTDLDINLDQANDLATQGGRRQLEQSVALDVLDASGQFVGEQLTATELGLLEERVRSSLNADEQVADVRQVDVARYDRRSNTVTIDIVTTENEQFTIEVPT